MSRRENQRAKPDAPAAPMTPRQPMRRRRSAPRWAQALNLAVFLIAALIIMIALNFFAAQARFRAQIDATKTRAYSLSDQTRQMLGRLEGQWTLAMVVSEANVSRSLRKQMDEVLSRFTQASPNIRVRRIDPANPRTLLEYEALLRDLQAIYASRIAEYDAALDAGAAAFEELRLFAGQHAPAIATAAQALPQQDASRQRLGASAGALGVLAEQGQTVVDAVASARRVSEAQPIPDYETARSILAEALTQWSNETDAVASIFRAWQQRANLEGGARQFAANTTSAFEQMAQRLAQAADPLRRLPELELSEIGRQIAEGEAAVVLGPERAAVIPSAQLFPKSNFRATRLGGTMFDQRFRGEHLISAAIRSLTVEVMPMVVFVHAEGASLMQVRDRRADLLGAASVLRTGRYEVREWDVGGSATPPASASGQRVVWVVVPPPPARSVEATPGMRALFEQAQRLIDEGASVLLSVYPSLLAKYGQTDPFQVLAEPFGLRPLTGEVIFERLQVAAGQWRVNVRFGVRDFNGESAIGRAVDGQQMFFEAPVTIARLPGAGDAGVIATDVVSIDASSNRWLEPEWTGGFTDREPRPDRMLTEPAAIVVEAQRPSPTGSGTQRFLLVGYGGWMVTNVADALRDIGGGRTALENPGNHELLLASVAWLAGMDELIAASPMSQEVARLRGITPQVRAAWWWIVVVGVPALCVLMGAGVWLWRRM